MPVIAIDPTEARDSSTLPQATIRAASQIQNFERETSADILISPLPLSLLPSIIDGKRINRIKLKKHCEAGALIQRKSGSDLLNSLKKLPVILERMKAWCPRNYLLITGSFYPAKDGKVICNGRKTGWNYNSFTGFLQAWQEAGGYIRFLRCDDDITKWITSMQHKLKAIHEGKVKYVRRPLRKVVSWDSKDRFKNILADIWGVGPVRANSVGDYCGSLAMSLVFLSHPEEYGGLCGVPTHVFHRFREMAGLKEGQYIHILDKKFE